MADMEFKCPSCGKTLEIDEAHKGKRTTCPACKTPIMIPVKPSSSDAPQPRIAGLAQAPVPTSDPLPSEEKDVFRVRPAWRAFVGRFLFAALFPAGALAFVLAASATPKLKLIVSLAGAGLGLIFFLVILVKRYSLMYRLSTQRLFVARGLIARRIEELELFRIRDIDVVQNFWERILGYGRMMVYSTDATTPKFEIVGLAHPVKLKDIIRSQFRSARIRERVRPTEFISDFEGDTDIGQHDPSL